LRETCEGSKSAKVEHSETILQKLQRPWERGVGKEGREIQLEFVGEEQRGK
jgi:hypothetical protein